MKEQNTTNGSMAGEERESWSSSSVGGIFSSEFTSGPRSQHQHHFSKRSGRPLQLLQHSPPTTSTSEKRLHRYHHNYSSAECRSHHSEMSAHLHHTLPENHRLGHFKTLGIGGHTKCICMIVKARRMTELVEDNNEKSKRYYSL